MRFEATEVRLLHGCGKNGAPFKEYAVTSSTSEHGTTTVSCFVESEVGGLFSTEWTTSSMRRGYDQRSKLLLDGVSVRSCTRLRSSGPIHHIGLRQSQDGTQIRPFTFSALRLTDDESVATTSENVVQSLGTIRLAISEVILGQKTKTRFEPATVNGCSNTLQFDEQSKKARLSQSTGVGRCVSVQGLGKGSPYRYPVVWSAPHPLLVFEFKYRSRELLESEGIIPPAELAAVAPPALRSSGSPLQRQPGPAAENKPHPDPVAGPSGSHAAAANALDVKPLRDEKPKRRRDEAVIDLTDIKPAKQSRTEHPVAMRGAVIDLT